MRINARDKTSQRIAIVDDDAELLESTRRLLEREGHDVRVAMTAEAAVDLVRSWRPQLLLLDYYLAGETGEAVVRRVREFDELCQIILVTGYAAEHPARRLLKELDIEGYHDKSDGPQRLLVLVDAALKHAGTLRHVVDQGAKLQHILRVTPELSRFQPIDQLLKSALVGLSGLVHGADGFIATTNSGLFVLGQACERLSIRAATGRFVGVDALSELSTTEREMVNASVEKERPHRDERGYVVVPLRTRDDDRGCMVVEASALPPSAIEPCEIYGRQVVQALENVLLYERATVDALSRLHTRAYGLQRLEEALHLDARTCRETSVILLDIDHFKRVNDVHGHAAGDIALRRVGECVRNTCRATDVASRYGGEEILVTLPATSLAGAVEVAERLRAAIERERFSFEGAVLGVTASLGIASFASAPTAGSPPLTRARLTEIAERLLRRADRALYRSKADGRNRVTSDGACQEEVIHVSAA